MPMKCRASNAPLALGSGQRSSVQASCLSTAGHCAHSCVPTYPFLILLELALDGPVLHPFLKDLVIQPELHADMVVLWVCAVRRYPLPPEL